MATDDLKRNIVKVLTFVGLAYVGYKIVDGLSKNKSASEIVKDTVKPVENVAAEVKKVTKKFLKGSPEAKAHMASLRAKRTSKAAAGKKGGEATAALGKHKGHKSKQGLAADQAKTSKESHEKHYRMTKNHEGFDKHYGK